MPRAEYKRGFKQYGPYEGPRVGKWEDFVGLDDLDLMNLEEIWDAMELSELLVFEYSKTDRVVAPFVLGMSHKGNPLLRGYQLEGTSKSGKGKGWRVFQVREMSMVDGFGEFFYPEDFKFVNEYPWTYKVYKMLEGSVS